MWKLTYQEQELDKIAKSLAEISKTLKQILAASGQKVPHDVCGGDDCTNCQCSTCANRTTCKMKQDDILSDIMTSPCNGCQNGQRHMPVESAHCANYAK
jgi:hypothetical protein